MSWHCILCFKPVSLTSKSQMWKVVLYVYPKLGVLYYAEIVLVHISNKICLHHPHRMQGKRSWLTTQTLPPLFGMTQYYKIRSFDLYTWWSGRHWTSTRDKSASHLVIVVTAPQLGRAVWRVVMMWMNISYKYILFDGWEGNLPGYYTSVRPYFHEPQASENTALEICNIPLWF